MADIRTSGMGGVPKGTTADRPSSPSIGDVFYNGTLGCLEIYTSQGWVANSAPPGIPTIGTATYSATNKEYNNASASVSFTPGEGGGLPNLYRATSTPGGFSETSTTSPITVSGLQSATAYTFSVTGTNNFGTSASSTNSNSITANTVPQAPTIGLVTPVSSTSLSVAFTPGSSGGSTVTSYTVTSTSGNKTATGTSSPITVSGLTAGVDYNFTVTATNANGTSLPSAASASVSYAMQYLVIAGGGGTGNTGYAGGGAGGYRSSVTGESSGGGSSAESEIQLIYGDSYTITVGAGGPAASSGVNSSIANNRISTITSLGGGRGGNSNSQSGLNGGSGGGRYGDFGAVAGNGTNGQGYGGGNGGDGVSVYTSGGGGGGAGGAGQSVNASPANGGVGVTSSITGSTIQRAGGGSGACNSPAATGTGTGGGGSGSNGTANTGGGGGATFNQGYAGGSGVVILRTVAAASATTGSPVVTTSGSFNIYQFNNSGSITF